MARQIKTDEQSIDEFVNLLAVDFDNPDYCWTFSGTILVSGYGRFRFQQKDWRAHRLAYHLFVGDIDNDVLHKCIGNRRCCNPLHLYGGDNIDNQDDRATQGRAGRKINMYQATCIKSLSGLVSNNTLACWFNISRRQVNNIRRDKQWYRAVDNVIQTDLGMENAT